MYLSIGDCTMDDSQIDFHHHLSDIEKYKTTLVPKWHEFVFRFPVKDQWKIALMLENTELARNKAGETSDSTRNNVFLNKAALYDTADWFLNFPFRDIVSVQPISQPASVVFHQTNGECMLYGVAARTKKDISIRNAFIDEIVTAILQVADYPTAAIPISEIDDYEKVIIGPPDTRIVATLRGINADVIAGGFEFRYENGHRIEDKGRITIMINGLPKNEVIYCFGSNSDFGTPITISPYVMSLLAPAPMSRAVVHAFKGAAKFFNRIRII